MFHSHFVKALCLLLTFSALTPIVRAQSGDTTPPVIQSITFSPSEINVSQAAQIVTVTTRITDDLSGFSSGSIQFRSPTGGQNIIRGYDAGQRISGDAKDGIYRFDLTFPQPGDQTFPQGAEAGEWTISFASAFDQSNNAAPRFPQTTPSTLTVVNGATQGSSIVFGSANYQFSEGDVRATIAVMRTGGTTGTATVDYRTTDTDTFTVGCADRVNNGGSAYARCDFATSVGILSFAPGETMKTITVPIIDDGHAEGAETFQLRLSNATGAMLGTPDVTTVTITDNDAAGAPNPVMNSTSFFVRQQYLDFLSREPDTNGFNAWLGLLNGCGDIFTGPSTPSGCDRIFVSGEGFFRSQEFQLKGFYVFRFYRLAFDRLPEYLEVVSDMSFVAGQTAEEVFARKAQLATLFTQRAEFQTRYGGMSDAQYVNTLLGRYGLTQVTTFNPANPDGTEKVTLTAADLTNRLSATDSQQRLTRAQVFRAIADSDAVGAAEFNNAFVGMQYYGYLRRKPDDAGFRAWLGVLQSGDVRTMVNGFLNSTEYKLRFGQP